MRAHHERRDMSMRLHKTFSKILALFLDYCVSEGAPAAACKAPFGIHFLQRLGLGTAAQFASLDTKYSDRNTLIRVSDGRHMLSNMHGAL